MAVRWILQSRQLSLMRFSWSWLQRRASFPLVPSVFGRSVLARQSRVFACFVCSRCCRFVIAHMQWRIGIVIRISSHQVVWVSSVFGCTHLSARVYLFTCLHSDQIVVICVLLVYFRYFLQHCWRLARKTGRAFERELKRIGLEILHFDLALEGDAEHPDARCGSTVAESL